VGAAAAAGGLGDDLGKPLFLGPDVDDLDASTIQFPAAVRPWRLAAIDRER
jgi:hypothetical protein